MSDSLRGKSAPELAADIARDSALLAKQELKLAKAKSQNALIEVGISIAYVVVAASLLTGAIVALLAAAIAGLTPHLPLWLSALTVGLVTLVLALVFVKLAQARLKRVDGDDIAPDINPTRTASNHSSPGGQ